MEHVLRLVMHRGLPIAIAMAILCVVLFPEPGLERHPLAVVGLGLIGLGLCKSERDRQKLVPAALSNDADPSDSR